MKSIREAIGRGRAPFYLRRTKEAMVYFPERQADGNWVARKLFTKRDTRTAGFTIDGDEMALYRAVTSFVRSQSHRAAANGDDPRARAVGFLMALYQRRLASSTYAVRHSLRKPSAPADRGLKTRTRTGCDRPARPSRSRTRLEEMEEAERERLEQILEAVTLAAKSGPSTRGNRRA